jgi:hypothetical protein
MCVSGFLDGWMDLDSWMDGFGWLHLALEDDAGSSCFPPFAAPACVMTVFEIKCQWFKSQKQHPCC